jgi:hypothetical protein
MAAIHHRHAGGNHPHVHRHEAASNSLHHRHQHNDETPPSHGHGDHAYDVHGNEAAIVVSDQHRLEHWHFDRPFEHVAIAPVRALVDSAPGFVAALNHDLSCFPLAARSPPSLT